LLRPLGLLFSANSALSASDVYPDPVGASILLFFPSTQELFPLRPGILFSSNRIRCHPMRRTILHFSLALLLAALPLFSQQTPPITLNVAAVNLLATVRDKHGNLVRNLSKDDFTLEQDAKPQTITYFAKDSDLPLTLGLLVDTSLSQRGVLDQERAAFSFRKRYCCSGHD